MTDKQTLNVTPAAKKQILTKRQDQSEAALNLRITVQGGGCSGFQYVFSWDSDQNNDDLVFDETLTIDEISLDLMGGAVIDYVEDINGSDFIITNPNATSGCGCGASFSI